MPIFAQYQSGDPFQVGPNMQNVLAQQKGVQDAMISMVDKFDQVGQEMDVLRSTTQSIMSQYGVDESGKPSPAAPKYVHDLYKAVDKEGGIGGLSKSNLLSALKGYEAGVQVEGQKQQILSAQQANALKAIELEDAQRKSDENKRILLAHKLAWELGRKPEAGVKTATDMPADMGEDIYKYYTGQTDIDPRTVPATTTAKATPATTTAKATPAPTKKGAEKSKTLENKTSPERDALELELEAKGASSLKEKLQEELADLEKELIYLKGSKGYPRSKLIPSIQFSALEPVGPKTLDEIQANKIKEPLVVKQIEEKKARIAEIEAKVKKFQETANNAPIPTSIDTTKPVGNRPIMLPSEVDKNYSIASNFLRDNPERTWKPKLEYTRDTIESLKFGLDVAKENKPYQRNHFRVSKEEDEKMLAKLQGDLKELELIETKYNAFTDILNNQRVPAYTAPIGPAGYVSPAIPAPVAPTPVPSSVAPKSTSKPLQKAKPTAQTGTAQPQQRQPQAVNANPMLKSDDEKIAEEYGMLTDRLKALGSIPLNWSESTYREMRGYAPKIQMIGKNGIIAVGIGDKWQVIKAGGETGMSPSEMASYEKHQILKDAIRTDRMSNKKWTFRGDVRTTETNEAGKVKTLVTDTTRALDALDRLIGLGDAGTWESITPSEKSGVITGITNAVQAAGRTEIAGSGAFSEEDARKLADIVPNIATMSNTIFRNSALARLKEYRIRMAQKVADVGRVWGFEVIENNDAGLTQEQIVALRADYLELIKQGIPPAEAQRLALENLSK
jgi:hypothetical protein